MKMRSSSKKSEIERWSTYRLDGQVCLKFGFYLSNGQNFEFVFDVVNDFIGKKRANNTKSTLIGMRQSIFTPLVILGLDFVSWIWIKNFQTFLEVKIDINRVNLTPCQAGKLIESYKTCSLMAPSMSNFLCFLSSCH